MTEFNDSAETTNDDESVSPAELAHRLDRGDPITLLDVRNRAEIERWAIDGPGVVRTEIPYVKFQAARVNGAIDDLAGEIEYTSGNRGADENAHGDTIEDIGNDGDSGNDRAVVVVCGRGEASATVADSLIETGIDARNLAGGMDEWGRVYTATRLDSRGTDATVYQYRRPSSGCLSYLVVSDRNAAVVDPLWAFADRYEADAAGHDASLTHAIDTHIHADHLSGLQDLGERGVERILPTAAATRGVTFDTRTVADGEEITVGDATLHAVSLPGHTTGMTGFVISDLLMTGDSVFLDGVARPDLEAEAADAPDGASETTAAGAADTRELAKALYETLTTRLDRFDDDTLVAPGHHGEETKPDENGTYTARLSDLRERLSTFETDRDAFVERVLGGLGAQPANHERILRVNLGVDSLDAGDASTLELGPNNCAAGPVTTD